MRTFIPGTIAVRLAMCLVTAALAAWGCGGSPTAPSATQPPAVAEAVTISGRVYASVAPVYPNIENATIEVHFSDGSADIVTSDAEGFYTLTTHRGSITVTSWKDGFEPKQLQFDLARDTVLNFSLEPR